MATETQVDEQVIQTLNASKWTETLLQGFLIGQKTDLAYTVIGFAKLIEISNDENYHTYVEKYLSGSLKICGVVINCQSEKPSQKIWNQLRSLEALDTDNNLLVCVVTDGGNVNDNSFYWMSQTNDNDDNEPRQAEIRVKDINIFNDSILTRIKTNLSVNILGSSGKITKSKINSEFEKLCDEISDSGSYVFGADEGVLISQDDVIGLKKNATASHLAEYLKSRNGNHGSMRQQALPLTVYKKLACNNNVPTCAPFIQQTIGEGKSLVLHLPIDVLCLVPKELTMKDVYTLLCDSFCSQLDSMKSCLLEFKKDAHYHQTEVFHFQPKNTNLFLSVVYPKGIDEDKLHDTRKHLHTLFSLPQDSPLLRRSNRYIFCGEDIPGGYLLNPHTAIVPNPLKDSKFYLVQGNYTYHHYMQDKFDDDKWGCAYRSLQTLVSWFIYQGYTNKTVPSHREIQQALVDIGDKDPKFVGSKKWIGSLEVSYCLEHLIGVTSKILSVSTGAELANKGRELAQHFTAQGSPIMIGGGVLAHTILGVNFSEVTGALRFLILDPHFTGGENIREIIDRGWCGWKGTDFWDQTAMYNMCLPQKPNAM